MQFIKKKAANRTQTKATKSAVNGQTDPNSEGFVFPSLAALQRAFRIAYPTAQEWKRRGMPAREDGKTYSLPAVIEWLQERNSRQQPVADGDMSSQDIRKQKAALELEKEQIDVESRRLKLRRDMGGLVSRELALTKQRRQNAEIRRQLEAIPGRLARIFPAEYRDDLVAELENQVFLILRRFALGKRMRTTKFRHDGVLRADGVDDLYVGRLASEQQRPPSGSDIMGLLSSDPAGPGRKAIYHAESRAGVSRILQNFRTWKAWMHQRLSTPLGNPGAMTLFQATPQEHFALAKHLTAEIKTEEFVAGKGVVVKWHRVRRNNHWLDALYNASAAGNYCGVRLVGEETPKRQRVSLRQMGVVWGIGERKIRIGTRSTDVPEHGAVVVTSPTSTGQDSHGVASRRSVRPSPATTP